MDATNLADLYELPLLDWAAIDAALEEGLTRAPGTGGPDRHTCWLATVNPDGGPHLTAVGAYWIDGTFWFITAEGSRKGRNLARNPRCTMGVAAHAFDLSLEGEAHPIDDPAVVADKLTVWQGGGWPAQVDDSGRAVTADYSAPSAGPPPWRMYRIEPIAATALATVDPGGATRWHFDRP